MNNELQVYLDRLRNAAFEVRDFSGVPRWLEKHTADPLNNDRRWSFREHEYQIDILSDTVPELSMQKCSQVGASEIWVRLVLAMMAISKKITIMYLLPTSNFAKKFSNGRIQPIIDDSDTLKKLIDKNLNNAEQKKIGRSLLYIAGTYGQSSAISTPAQALFRDEVDFCDQRVLTTYDSRLGHSKEGDALKRSFSTPTVFKFGINKLFIAGSQACYTVRCPRCNDRVAVDYFRDVVIPGYEGTLREFEKEDLMNPLYRVDEAFFLCPGCRNPIPHEAFVDPANRLWVHQFPDRVDHHSYQVLPIDVAAINPLRRTIRQIGDYESKKDWVNFKVGLPWEDSESSFLEEQMRLNALTWFYPRPNDDDQLPVTNGTYMGVDVGKTLHLTITKPNGIGGVDIIYKERIRQDGDNYASKRMVLLFKLFGCAYGVIDAGPDITLAQGMVKALQGRFMACRYSTQQGQRITTLDVLTKIDEEEGIVTVSRNAVFDSLVKKVNKGLVRLTQKSPEFELYLTHLKSMKRVETVDNESGERYVQWVTTGDDHYAHSLVYADVARRLREIPPEKPIIPYVPSVSTVRLKEAGDADKERGRIILPKHMN